MTNPRASVFEAIRAVRPVLAAHVAIIDKALDDIGFPRSVDAKPTPTRRQINASALQLVKDSEGLRLKAYLCPAKVWTIGYGSTGTHVKSGMVITEARAEELLREDLARFEEAVAKAAPNATDNQFGAMVSLAFNIGIAAFLGSTVLRKHKAGDHHGAAEAFKMWNKGGGKVLPGLVTRRAKEAQLYRAQP